MMVTRRWSGEWWKRVISERNTVKGSDNKQTVGKIDNCKFKFRTRFIMTRIKSSMHDSNILDSTYIINIISENMIMKQI